MKITFQTGDRPKSHGQDHFHLIHVKILSIFDASILLIALLRAKVVIV